MSFLYNLKKLNVNSDIENYSEENPTPLDLISFNSNNISNLLKENSPNITEIGLNTEPIDNKIKIVINNSDEIANKKNNHRGRKRKKNKSEGKIHSKFESDNMFLKVNGHYINFITDYVNTILDILDCEYKFLPINYKDKISIDIKYFSELKNSNIGEILKKDISPRYSIQPKYNNKNSFENLINKNSIINKLLSENYLNLFKNVYYKSERNINLNKYGINMNIKLAKNKVKMFKDLLEKKENKANAEYIKKLDKFVMEKFINNYK
jgi:hypothetical protein